MPQPPDRQPPALKGLYLLMALILWASVLQDPYPAQAREPLRGSATLSHESPTYGPPYYPSSPLIKQADALAQQFKLGAAEALYRNALTVNPKDAGAWNGLGKVTYYRTNSSNGNFRLQTGTLYGDAIQDFMNALRYQPGYVEAHVNLASVYLDQHRMMEAQDQLSAARTLAPNDGNVIAAQGEWLAREGRYNDALPYLKDAVAINSANTKAQYYLGITYLNRGEVDDAHERFQTVVALDPSHAGAHAELAKLYEQQGNESAAIEEAQKSLSLKPEQSELRQHLARLYERRGDYDAELQQLKSAAASSIKPDWSVVDRIGRISVRNNQPEVAVIYYRDWLNRFPNDVKASVALSYAKTQVAKKKRRDDDLISQGEAKRYAEQGIVYNPNNFEARLIDTKMDRSMGMIPSRAAVDPRVIDIALSVPSNEPFQSFEKADILMSRYQYAEADRLFASARLAATDHKEQMEMGELYLNKGMPVQAEDTFRQVLGLVPDDEAAQLGLSKAQEARRHSVEMLSEARQLHKKNDISAAILKAREALRSNSRNADAHYLLASLYERRQNYAEAADHYYAYLQLSPYAGNRGSVSRKIEHLKKRLARQ